MIVSLKYGKTELPLTLPDTARVTLVSGTEQPVVPDLGAALAEALQNPLGAPALASRPAPFSVAIAVPDETRPCPLKILLPVLLEHIHTSWPTLPRENIRIVVGGGLHPQPDPAQLERILPESVLGGGYTIVAHDAEQSPLVSFGVTSRGTPVEVNAAVGTAAFKMVIGMIDPHQFVGMTGGSKGITIGCASRAMIEHNHGLMSSERAFVGNVDDNPVRQDLHEAGEILGIDLAVNVVLDPAKRAVALLAGAPRACVAVGGGVCASVYAQTFEKPFDIAVAACGGYPKDICLYQAQKGLNLASQCLRPGGRLLLLAACPQGVGDDHYQNYVRQFATPEEQMQEFAEKGFRMGAHKAFLFSRTLTGFEVVLHSELDAETLRQCHITKGDAQSTLDYWFSRTPNARVAVIPNANTLYFRQSC